MRPHATALLLVLILALPALADGDGTRSAFRAGELARRARPLPTQTADPSQLALALRRRADPEPLQGFALLRFNLREMLLPSQPVREPNEGQLSATLAGFASGADRSRLPEFTAARLPGGVSIQWHLQNAILMNTSRMGYYAGRAGPLRARSLRLSRLMVLGETLSLSSVRPYDAAADALRARGLPPLSDDLVALRPLPRETPPTYRGVADADQRRQLRERLQTLSAEVERALDQGQLRRVADLCHAALEDVMGWERAWGVHWQMTRHVVGNLGQAALRGDAYQDPQRRALTVGYARTLLGHSLRYGRMVDRMAQPLQARGLGIVVNEFTDQAFLDAYARAGAADVLAPLGE